MKVLVKIATGRFVSTNSVILVFCALKTDLTGESVDSKTLPAAFSGVRPLLRRHAWQLCSHREEANSEGRKHG